MKKRNRIRVFFILFIMVMGAFFLSACDSRDAKKEDKETIQVYLWTTNLYEKYAPYIQSQLPDVNIEFIVGNNDLDFYKFLQENGSLPDIITCCRFSLHDALPLKDSLMDLSTTNEAGAVYNSYLNNFMNDDGSVNWLPVCADAHGFVVNRALFKKYHIPIPTDYESFVSACRAFEKVGIRGFVADYFYDYTCMETLQGLSATELSSTQGRKWRTSYADPASTNKVGLDDEVWPDVFDKMEQFIKDTKLKPDDLQLNYDKVADMYQNGEAAMYFGSSAGVKKYKDQGIDTIFLPFFEQNGEKWIMTTPYFQVALNRDLEKDKTRRDNAMKVLKVMLSEEAQNIIADGQDTLSYSQNVALRLTDYLKDVKSVIEENHMYIRIASNEFFAVSKDVVSKMIEGKYNSEQAYKAFDSQLRQSTDIPEEKVVRTSKKAYSNYFHSDGGNEAYSVMANTLRSCYKSDVLIATANSFTGNVLQTDYTEKMAGNMIMPNGLWAYKRKMNGAELKKIIKFFVEGYEGGFTPFNCGSLPVISGISIEVEEKDDGYTLTKITKDGKTLKDKDTFIVTCLATQTNMDSLPVNETEAFEAEDMQVKDAWTQYVSKGKVVLAKPEQYITLR